jgi:hypothetical protein
MSVPAVLIRKSTLEIIKEADYPRIDNQPVEGLDPDYEWLVKHIPYNEPDYDPRIYIMETLLPDLQFLSEFEEHPDFDGVREYRISFNPKRRENDEIIREIENAEKSANELVFSEAVHKDQLTSMLNAVHKDAKSLSLTTEEQEYIDKLAIINVAIAKNKDNKEILIAKVSTNQVPNIDSGWQKSM